MNYTKYLIALIIFNFCMALVANIDYFSSVVPTPDMSIAESAAQSAESGSYSIWDMASYLMDAVILAMKITVLAPYYTGKTLEMFGIHPIVSWMITGINYMVYVMWIIDIKRGKPFFV